MTDELKYIVSIEGQSIPVPAEMGSSDDLIKSALTPFFPGIATGKIHRGEAIDGVVTITIIKQAGTKGAVRQAPSDQEISDQAMNPDCSLREQSGCPSLDKSEMEGLGSSRANHIEAVSPVMVMLIPPAEDGRSGIGVVLRKLQRAKSEKNPVVALMERFEMESIAMQQLPPHELLKLDRSIEKALKNGEKEAEFIKLTQSTLQQADPICSPVVPEGF